MPSPSSDDDDAAVNIIGYNSACPPQLSATAVRKFSRKLVTSVLLLGSKMHKFSGGSSKKLLQWR